MTDPEFADATYIEPITPGDRRIGHRAGNARMRCCRPRWPDRFEIATPVPGVLGSTASS